VIDAHPQHAAISRRQFLAGGAAAAAAAGSRCASGDRSAGRLRVMLNGGIYEELARRLVVQPFERDTGGSVDIVPGSAAEMIARLRAERATPTIDVAIVDRLVIGANLDDTLFEKIDPSNIPNMQSLAPEALDPAGYGPIVHCHNLAIGYNTKRLQVEPPRSWADLWDARFAQLVVPGVIELTPGLLFLLQANVLNGGTYDNVEPGFDAMRRLKPNLRRFYRSIGEVRPMLNNENVVVAISTNIIQGEIDRGNPVAVVMPQEGCLASPAAAQVVKGSRAKAMAERFIDYYLRPDAQSGWAREYFVSVFNQKADVPASLKSRIGERIVFFDADKVSRGREAWIDRWTREVRG
jgi:putative spermidine/putrescine transport system substrate-binding protein